LLLREEFRELLRTLEVARRPRDFKNKMAAAEVASASLRDALRSRDEARTGVAFSRVGAACASCHRIYRNVPHGAL